MTSRRFWKGCRWIWRCAKAVFQTRALVDWLRDIPDPRCSRAKPHEMAEIFVCVVMGFLAGVTSLRRIVRWSEQHLEELRRHMPFLNGVPSLSTVSRMLSSVDEDMVSYAFMNWIGEISSTRGIHIAIDGKGLRAAASKVGNERTPYILNAIDTASMLVIAQLAISEKTNEMTAIPGLLEILDISGSTVTIDAIGATEQIMNAVCNGGGSFVLQVKGNCPALYAEIESLFSGLTAEKEADDSAFRRNYDGNYSEIMKSEKNRERYEYRKYQSYSDPDCIGVFQEERPWVSCVGFGSHIRIMQTKDASGEDTTLNLAEFLKNGGSWQRFGLISSSVLDAEKLMEYKRNHWAIENSLHYVLDETFGEDKSTVRLGKNTVSMLRKCAYNITRLLQMKDKDKKKGKYIPDIIDDIRGDLEIGLRMIFLPIPSFY